MKIAVLTSSYPRFPGDSAAPFVMSISEELAKQGNNVSVLAPYDVAVRDQPSVRAEVHRFRYIWPKNYHIMGHARALIADIALDSLAYFLLPFYLLSAYLSLMRLTGKQKSEVIHVHWVIPNGLIAALVATIRRIPFIVSLHGSDVYVARRNWLFRSVARYIFRRAASVTACSEDLKRSAIELGATPETLLLPWGADPDLFMPNRRNASTRQVYGYAQDDPMIVALGRLVHKKGFSVLISAFSEVIKEHPNTRLLIGGDGPLRGDLTRQCGELGIADRVLFPGNIAWRDVPDVLSSSDIFVLPSIRDEFGNVDGLPTVLLEAMSSGCAIVASEIGGVSLVIDDQVNGLLVPPGNPRELASVLSDLVADPQKKARLGDAARESVENRLNWTTVARHLTRLFQNAIWKKGNLPRLGTVYRDEMLKAIGQYRHENSILDIGCHDGYRLNDLDAQLKIGVDMDPIPGAPNVSFVQADGRFLPFKRESFDLVFALDVIEHVADDRAFAEEISLMVKPDGRLFLSTPSELIKVFPPFLTGWVSLKWGHDLRIGYKKDELAKLFSPELDVTIRSWNAPRYRLYYLPVRLLSAFAPRLAAGIVRKITRIDALRQDGDNGFYLLIGRKR